MPSGFVQGGAQPTMRSSQSVPAHNLRRLPPSSFLPHLGGGRSGDATPGKRGSAGAVATHSPGKSISSFPAKARMPEALSEIEQFLHDELTRLDAANAPPEVRLQAHREAFDLFIAHFGTYAAPLSSIKREYEAQIDTLQATLARSQQRFAAANAEFLSNHEQITASLASQLLEANERLARARQRIAALEDGDVDLDTGEPVAAASGEGLAQAASARGADVKSTSLGVDAPAQATSDAGGARSVAASGKWSLVTKSLDDPMLKAMRLLKAVERLCTTPVMLSECARKLLTMMTASQLSEVFGNTIHSLSNAERVMMGSAIAQAMPPVERAIFFGAELRLLPDVELASVLETGLAHASTGVRTPLMPFLVDATASDEERLAFTRALLEWRPPRAPVVAANPAPGSPPSPESRVADASQLRARNLAHADSLLEMLVDVWGEEAATRTSALVLSAMPPHLRHRTCGQILASADADPLQLEQALELIYAAEEEQVADQPQQLAQLATRRRESALARNMLREGRAPRLIANALRVRAADASDGVEASGGWRLTCDCTREWVLPNVLLGKLRGERGTGAMEGSIRRYEDERFFETAERKREAQGGARGAAERKREPSQMRSVRSMRRGGLPVTDTRFGPGGEGPQATEVSAPTKPAWHLSTGHLLHAVAELWTEVLTDHVGRVRAGRGKLCVAKVLWERLLRKHALKSVGQRALADLTSSLAAEAAAPECPGRLRLAAEMIGLGTDETPWTESKALFFFWLLPLCVPARRMQAHLLDPQVKLPYAAVLQLLAMAVTDDVIRTQVARRLKVHLEVGEMPTVLSSPDMSAKRRTKPSSAVLDPPTPSVQPAGQTHSERGLLSLDAVLVELMAAWSRHLELAASADEQKLLHLTRNFDEDGDGVLDFNEFCKLVQQGVGLSLADTDILALYEEVLNRTQRNRRVASEHEQGRLKDEAVYTLRIPDAIDPAAFAEVVAQRTRSVPPGFYAPVVEQQSGPSVEASKNGSFVKGHGSFVKGDSPSMRSDGGAEQAEVVAAEVEAVVTTLASHLLFSSMERESLGELVRQMLRIEQPEGGRLIAQGEHGDYFYVLVSGHADALVSTTGGAGGGAGANEAAGNEIVVASYQSHSIDHRAFGERALLQAVPRQASVVLRTPCILYAMSRRLFRSAQRARALEELDNRVHPDFTPV